MRNDKSRHNAHKSREMMNDNLGNSNRKMTKNRNRDYESFNSESELEKEEINYLKETIDLLKKEVDILRTNQLVIHEQKANTINTSKDNIKQAD